MTSKRNVALFYEVAELSPQLARHMLLDLVWHIHQPRSKITARYNVRRSLNLVKMIRGGSK